MTIIQSIILGVIQGITEFIPVSSSAHLVLAPYYLGWDIPEGQAFLFDVLVQSATLVSVILYFWTDLVEIIRKFFAGLAAGKPFQDPSAKLGWLLILATIPAGTAGLFLEDMIESAFSEPILTAILLFGTAGLLVLAELVGKRNRPLEALTWKDAIWIGFFQALALFPGISRSGSTITGGMTRNLERPAAARFAFLMSIPIMLAATVFAASDLVASEELSNMLLPLLVGCLTAGIVGYLTIRWLLGFLNRRSLYPFAIYCALVGAFTLVLYFIR
ncbi:MAG TPA: undecaprenyl-diphosphatase UppP [Anaerolineales bacterium]|nr:undecaprenyl-diphosphatase UppP [Anaerolineales bacterium]